MFGASGASQPAPAFGAAQHGQSGFAFGQQSPASAPAFGAAAPSPTFGGGAFGAPAHAFSAGTSNAAGPSNRRKVVRKKR